jgi:hypothetical protein
MSNAPIFNSDDDEDGGEDLTPKGLRKKLEDTLGQLKEVTGQLQSERATRVIQEKGLTLVKPEDLKGVSLEELDKKAEEIQAERNNQKLEVLKDVFRLQGVAEEDLDAKASALLAPPTAEDPVFALGKLMSTPGTPITGKADMETLTGRDKLEAAFRSGVKTH